MTKYLISISVDFHYVLDSTGLVVDSGIKCQPGPIIAHALPGFVKESGCFEVSRNNQDSDMGH